MYLINQSNFMQTTANDVHVNNHLHHFITSNNHLNHLNQQLNQHQLTNHHHHAIATNHLSNHLSNHPVHTNINTNHPHHNNLNNNNSASYNCIVVANKSQTSSNQLIPHFSATNLTTTATSNGGTPLCFNCKNHAHHSSSVNKLSNSSSTSLTNATNSSTTNVYNRTKLEQSLNEAKRRVAQLKKELNHLQSNKQLNNQYLSSLNSVNSSGCLTGGEDQVDFAMSNNGTTSRESQIRMLNNYMQEAAESVYGSQSNSRHNSQLALPLIKQGLSSSSISTDSLRNSTSSVHLNHQLSNQQLNHLHINHPQCNSQHQCNHQISTSDSFASENIYSNQQIINNLNKSRSANTINFKSSGNLTTTNQCMNHCNLSNNLSNNMNHNNLSHNKSTNSLINASSDNKSEFVRARQRVIQLKKDLDASTQNARNPENYVIYSNQSAIIAQQKQLDLSQTHHQTQSPPLDYAQQIDLLTIIDKYYRKNDSTAAVEV